MLPTLCQAHPRRVAGRSPVEPPPAQGWGERCPKKTERSGLHVTVSLSMRQNIRTLAQWLTALSLLSLYSPRSRTLNAHSTHMPNLVEGGLRHTRHPSALRVHHDVGRDVVHSMVMSSVVCECSGSASAKMARPCQCSQCLSHRGLRRCGLQLSQEERPPGVWS